MPRVKRVLIVHPNLDMIGGAERLALFIVCYLLRDPAVRITILTLAPPDPDEIRRIVGIDLPFERIEVEQYRVPLWARRLAGRHALVGSALLHRRAKSIANTFDLCVSTFNEVDFGRPGVQYVHAPNLAPPQVMKRYDILPHSSPLRRSDTLLRVYSMVVARLAARREEGIRQNLTLTNSEFMRGVIYEALGVSSKVVYGPFPVISEKVTGVLEREPVMISVARIAPDKHTLALVEYLRAVHERLPDLRFVIAGLATDVAYLDAVRSRVAVLGLPVTFALNVTREEVEQLLTTSRYYVHAKPYEHFGLATVEAVLAGCLPFVHATGGSTEIVPLPALHFLTGEELAHKVYAVRSDPEEERSLVTRLRTHADRFTLSAFYRRVDVAINDFLVEQNADYNLSVSLD